MGHRRAPVRSLDHGRAADAVAGRGGRGLAERYFARLRHWAHGRLPAGARDLVDTDDLVQATLVRALGHAGDFEHRREGAFLAYIRQILLNQNRDQARRRPEHVELSGDQASDDRSLLDDLIGKENMEHYEPALTQLPHRQREALIPRIEMRHRYRGIAEGMELDTANAARKLVAPGLVRLAEVMRSRDGT